MKTQAEGLRQEARSAGPQDLARTDGLRDRLPRTVRDSKLLPKAQPLPAMPQKYREILCREALVLSTKKSVKGEAYD